MTSINPSKSISKNRPRSSSLSLSISRSPSVLSSGSIFPQAPLVPPLLTHTHLHTTSKSTDNLEESNIESNIKNHQNIYGIHPYSNPIKRVLSSGGGNLEPIIGDKEEEEEEKIYKISQQAQYENIRSDEREEEEEDTHNEINNVIRPLLPIPKVSFVEPFSNPSRNVQRTSQPSHSELEMENITYDGPFQPPDSKELLSIILSVVGVMILAIAAGCTTIFDWVL
ncbi:uncharacterized protein I206_105861 [Kwoniella pini CBS 10737]|uniref:Uncharacterized protein n=1 Tax=Kwoniella pini CBS 10737 TaxID=1296096 RepID=A0A1B9I0F8_9TREE|nr:uncharacterized protein I206_04681 [Kwoniella pini CBS 10737]OCF48994.1 hypothetical protein I206_04681 [Kwoniella pini CBS 10737]